MSLFDRCLDEESHRQHSVAPVAGYLLVAMPSGKISGQDVEKRVWNSNMILVVPPPSPHTAVVPWPDK